MDHLAQWTCFLGILLTACDPIHGSVLVVTNQPSGEINKGESSASGRFIPIPYVEMTHRTCNLESLPRVQDERYCNKYYVCSADRYVSLFCPTGMAFDYSQQNCRVQTTVDCSKRPLIATGATELAPESSSDTKATQSPVTASILMTPAATPTQVVTTAAPITTPVSDITLVSTTTTAATSTSRSRTGMKLSRGRKVHGKKQEPLRPSSRNSPMNQDLSGNKSAQEKGGEDNLNGGKSLPNRSALESRQHRLSLARAKAVKTAKAATESAAAIGVAAPLSLDRDVLVTTTAIPIEEKSDDVSFEDDEDGDSEEESEFPGLIN